MVSPDAPPICGEPTGYPVPVCTRPPGHSGAHASEIIPEELAAAAASAIRAREDAETARDEMLSVTARLRARIRLNARLAVVLLVVAAVNAAFAAVYLIRLA